MTVRWPASYSTAMDKLLVVLLLAAFAIPAEGVVLCAKPRANGTYSTTIKIREACVGKETTLDPAALGLQGPPGPPGPSPGLRILDSADSAVGHAAGPSTVVVASPSGTLLLDVAPSGFIGRGPLLYQNGICTGSAFIPSSAPSFVESPAVRGGVAFLKSGPPELVHVESFSTMPGGCTTLNADFELHPTTTLDLDTLGFLPPFRLVTSP